MLRDKAAQRGWLYVVRHAEELPLPIHLLQRVLEAAGKRLPFEVDGNEARAGVDGLVAGHGVGSKQDASMTLDIPFGSQQNAAMERLFLQLRWALHPRRRQLLL